MDVAIVSATVLLGEAMALGFLLLRGRDKERQKETDQRLAEVETRVAAAEARRLLER